ncbi:MAG: hypothetical protein AAGI30_04385 [Planctomycetota bacterium]
MGPRRSCRSAGGGLHDLSGDFRFQDDAGTPNTGIGKATLLDAGAYEFQGMSVPVLDPDFNMDMSVDAFDVTDLLQAIADFPTP